MIRNHILESNNRYRSLENFSEEMFDELRAIIRSPQDIDDFHTYLPKEPEPVTLSSLRPTVINMIARGSLGCGIDWGAIEGMIPNTKSSKNRLIVKLENLGGTVNIFKSGIMTSYGAKTTRKCYFSLLIAAKMIHNCGFQEVKFRNFELSNVCTTYDVQDNIDLIKLQKAFHTCSSYEPELDRHLTFHLSDPKTTARVSWTGKVTLLGNKSVEEAKFSFEKLYRLLHPYEIIPIPLSCCVENICSFSIPLKRCDPEK